MQTCPVERRNDPAQAPDSDTVQDILCQWETEVVLESTGRIEYPGSPHWLQHSTPGLPTRRLSPMPQLYAPTRVHQYTQVVPEDSHWLFLLSLLCLPLHPIQIGEHRKILDPVVRIHMEHTVDYEFAATLEAVPYWKEEPSHNTALSIQQVPAFESKMSLPLYIDSYSYRFQC